MLRASILAALLFAAPAHAVVIDCPDGRRCATNDPATCPCVEVCSDGTWVIHGEAPCPDPPSAGPAAIAKAAGFERGTSARDVAAMVFSVVLLIGVVALYFAPTLVARRKMRFSAIFALNLLLGWTVIGWVGALVWALAENEDASK